ITGTDTGIGKTSVSRVIADCLSEHLRLKTTYFKPVQTGCNNNNGELIAPDFEVVMAGKALKVASVDHHVPYRYEPACSPHFAAALKKEIISFEKIKESFNIISKGIDIVIVEGAGGIMAPLGETTFIIDLIVHLRLPVIVVTTPRLGTLNHTLLTLRVIHESGIKIAGIVFNNFNNEEKTIFYKENLRMIKTHTHPIPFLELDYGMNEKEQRVKDFCNEIIQKI
ncbi:MAG: dethiobiotin synthase, partial [Chitinispirillaceae bacterium]|nr:dethiobiotin synthase [Chitinispirillaceae bacterium]